MAIEAIEQKKKDFFCNEIRDFSYPTSPPGGSINPLTAIVGYIQHDADDICSACSASYKQNH